MTAGGAGTPATAATAAATKAADAATAAPDLAEEPQRRGIRSYVLRRSHFSPAQRAAYERQMPRFGVPYTPAPLDVAALFGRLAPVVLVIGFGMGDSTADIARRAPAVDFIGIEVHTPGVGALLKQVEALGLTNLRVIEHDARAVVRDMIQPESLSGVHIFFPDPWPKARHHKRRLIQPPLIALLASRLKTGGYLHCATDWENYAEQMLAVLSAEPTLENTAEGFAPRPDYRPLTKFEQRGIRLGHGVWDVIFRKKAAG